jgi:hypothetical protein
VVGPKSRNWLFSGDEVADRDAWGKFLTAYDRKNALSKAADGRVLLQVGDGDWAFPAPIVNKGKGWVFDSAAGREEIINRRVGENELSVNSDAVGRCRCPARICGRRSGWQWFQ